MLKHLNMAAFMNTSTQGYQLISGHATKVFLGSGFLSVISVILCTVPAVLPTGLHTAAGLDNNKKMSNSGI